MATKIILATGVLLFGGSLIFGLEFFKYNRNLMMQNLTHHSRSSADLIKKSIHYGMLTGQGALMQKTIRNLSTQKDVLDINVLDTDGRVVFAAKEEATGRMMELTPALAEALHGRETPPVITDAGRGVKVLKFQLPIHNEPACYSAACHVHPPDKEVLGVLQTSFSAEAIETTRQQMFRGTLLIGLIFVLSISAFMFLILYKFVTRPVARLQRGMEKLGKGDLDAPIKVTSRDEIGLLAKTFNSMARDLRASMEQTESLTRNLKAQVDRKTSEIMNAQEQIINAEKLASLGRMAAGVAHELNNPLTGIMTFAHLFKDRIPPDKTQDIEDIDVIIEQTERCSKIIKGMLGFARKSFSESTKVDINSLLLSIVAMVKNQAKFHNVVINTELEEDLPSIVLDSNQVQQVFLNMLTNAADAMNDRGEIKVSTRTIAADPGEDERQIEIEFTDNGPGITPEDLGKIFEPFYTTKPVGKGTGLGLPVSYGIIKKHGGDIIVRSQAGQGTSFFIRLPVVSGKEISEQEGENK